jgi:HEPN domain-containing protein
MKKLTAAWVRKAEADYRVARELAPSRPPAHDMVCFCCQQAAEKYMKAVLAELGLSIPRTHILEDLLGLLRPHYPKLIPFRRGLVFLSRFAVDYRYPGYDARKRQATAALHWAGRIRKHIRLLLGIRSHRRKQRP